MPGQYVDAESGLFYNWNRYYNPSIGRYISSDPIGIEGGLNTFLYAEASPVMYADPEGLATSKCIQNPRAVECIVLEGSIGGGRLSGGTGTLRWRTLGKALISSVFGMSGENPDEKAKVATPARIRGQVCTPASPQGEGPGDPDDDEPNIQDLKNISSHKEANKVAEEAGFKDAHDAKAGRGESKVNIYRDKKTGKYYLWDGKATSAREPL